MLLLIGLFLTFVFGYILMIFLGRKMQAYERLSLAVIIGLGLMTQLLFVLEVFNINYTKASILLSLLGIDTFLYLGFGVFREKTIFRKVVYIRVLKDIVYWFKSLSRFEQFFVFLLILLVVSAFIRALYWPVWYWDALALYDYRGRIFSVAGGIANSAAISSLPMHSYPPMTSLAHTFVYILGGERANPQFIYPLFYVALLTTFYASIRKYSQQWASLLVTLFLASIPFFVEFSANAYTNLPYAFYLGMGTVYLYRFIKEGDWGILMIAGILLGLSGWTRSPTEQFYVVNLLVLTLVCLWRRKHIFAPVVLTTLFVALAIPWRFYVAKVLHIAPVSTEVTNALSAGISQPFYIEKLISVFVLLIKSIMSVSGTSLFLVLLAILFLPKMVKKNIPLLAIIFLNFVILAAGSYSFSLSWQDWKDSITNSADRLSMIFPPLALYFIGISVPSFLNSAKKKR